MAAGVVETRPFAPFAPSVLKASLAGAAAVEELRKGRAKLNAKEGSWEAADAAAAAELAAGALDAALPSGALVVVVGGGTALGRALLSVLGQGDAPVALRSLALGSPPAPPPRTVAP